MKLEFWNSTNDDNSQTHYCAVVTGKNPMENLSLGQIDENDILKILGQKDYNAYHSGKNVFTIRGAGFKHAESIFSRLAFVF